jgi:hypothetical protein
LKRLIHFDGSEPWHHIAKSVEGKFFTVADFWIAHRSQCDGSVFFICWHDDLHGFGIFRFFS